MGRAKKSPEPPEEGALRSVSTPKQARSEETLQRLLDAAEALILEHGLADVGITDIVREASSSVGGFYSRFRNKGELLLALHERRQRAVRGRVRAMMESDVFGAASARRIVHECVRMLIAETASRHRMQAAFLQAVVAEPVAWQTGIDFRRQLVDLVTDILLRRRDQIGHPEPDQAVPFAVHAALALMDQRALFNDIDPRWTEMDPERLGAEMERLVCAYLAIP